MASVDPASYLAASAFSSLVTFPLWKAAAIGQSNYVIDAKTPFLRYWQAVKPPWTGSLAVVSGMAWARAAIFVGSEKGGIYLRQLGYGAAVSTILPTLSISTFVSVVNQPFVRSTVMLQDPQCMFYNGRFPNIAVMRHLVQTKGVGALWLGTNASVLKTAPKFIAAVAIKDGMEKVLAPVDGNNKSARLIRSLKKSLAAGSIGAVLTNPLDVVRNEMFKTDEHFSATCRRLCRQEGFRWLVRGCERNLISVAAPITGTIFMADIISDGMKC